MEISLLWIGRLAGLAGVFMCLIAVSARLAGAFWIAGFQAGTLLQAGMAAMLLGCLAHLVVLTARLTGDKPLSRS
jgi:hypothetical protein